MTITYVRQEYSSALRGWERVRAACSGEDAVKKLPNVLPYLNAHDKTAENAARNEMYLERAVYFNACGRTLEGLIGLAFARDPEVEFGVFKYLADDADGRGVSIYHIAQQALSGVLQTGRHGILTDFINGEPRLVGYKAEEIINWRVEYIKGKKTLTLLVLQENTEESDGEFGMTSVDRYREYRLVDGKVVSRVWEKGEASDHVSKDVQISRPDSRNPSFTEIPFEFIGSITNTPDVQPSPLRGLAEMNFAHFRDSADYQDSVFFSGQVQPWISGLSEEWRDNLQTNKLYVGSRNPILLPVGGTFGFAQAQPNMLVKEAMDKKEKLLVALGARVVEQSEITKTATQAAGDIATGTSVLGLCCANVSEAIGRAMQRCGLFKNSKLFTDAKFRITQDFSEQVMDANKLAAMVNAWMSGAIAVADLRDYMKRLGAIRPERTNEQINEEVSQELTDRVRIENLANNPGTGDPNVNT